MQLLTGNDLCTGYWLLVFWFGYLDVDDVKVDHGLFARYSERMKLL
ncbi:MAG: hypothetical protein ABIW38_08605 [Ferruginibacter sp.]